MITDVFLNQKRVNICECMVKMVPHDPCIHIHLLSSDWERHLWSSKCFNLAAVCFVCLSSGNLFIFSVRVSSFFTNCCVIRTSILSFPCGIKFRSYMWYILPAEMTFIMLVLVMIVIMLFTTCAKSFDIHTVLNTSTAAVQHYRTKCVYILQSQSLQSE